MKKKVNYRSCAIHVIISAAEGAIGEGQIDYGSEANNEKVIRWIDKICDQLRNSVKKKNQ
jgi:hypothetical protein